MIQTAGSGRDYVGHRENKRRSIGRWTIGPLVSDEDRIDAGLSLALALWCRSSVLLELGNGHDALADIQFAIDNGLQQAKQRHEYYLRLAKANACAYVIWLV